MAKNTRSHGRNERYCCSVTGRKEGLITGKIAGLVAEKIYTGAYPSGIYHIEQLFEPEEMLGKLEKIIEINEHYYIGKGQSC